MLMVRIKLRCGFSHNIKLWFTVMICLGLGLGLQIGTEIGLGLGGSFRTAAVVPQDLISYHKLQTNKSKIKLV